MGSNWKRYPFEDCMAAIIDYRGKTPKKTTYGIPLITAKIIKNGSIQPVKEFIAEEDYESWMRRGIPMPGDVVLTTEAPLGEVAQLDERKIALAQRVITLRGKPGFLDNTFLKYLLISSDIQHQLDGRGTGTTVKGIKQSELRKIELPIPEFSTQLSIAKILVDLDNKTELNKKTNQTLEQMAQTLFQSWFVDFDPVFDNLLAKVGFKLENLPSDFPESLLKRAEIRLLVLNSKEHKKAKAALISSEKPKVNIHRHFPSEFEYNEQLGWIPKGWKTCALGEKVVVKRGGSPRPIKDFIAPAGLPWTKISDATASQSRFIKKTKEYIKPEGLKKTTLLKKGTLILSNSATPGLPKFLDLDACIHDGWLHFPEKETFSDLYLYQLFLVVRKELVQQGNGSVFTNLKTDILKNHNLVVPSEVMLNMFDDFMKPIAHEIHAISENTVALEKLRDTLLPKLISGELHIPDVNSVDEKTA